MDFGKGNRKLSPGPSSHANICRLSRVCCCFDVDENSRRRHDVQWVYIEGVEVKLLMLEAARGGMLVFGKALLNECYLVIVIGTLG